MPGPPTNTLLHPNQQVELFKHVQSARDAQVIRHLRMAALCDQGAEQNRHVNRLVDSSLSRIATGSVDWCNLRSESLQANNIDTSSLASRVLNRTIFSASSSTTSLVEATRTRTESTTSDKSSAGNGMGRPRSKHSRVARQKGSACCSLAQSCEANPSTKHRPYVSDSDPGLNSFWGGGDSEVWRWSGGGRRVSIKRRGRSGGRGRGGDELHPRCQRHRRRGGVRCFDRGRCRRRWVGVRDRTVRR